MNNVIHLPGKSIQDENAQLRKEKSDLLDRLALLSRQYEVLEKEHKIVKQELANMRRRIY